MNKLKGIIENHKSTVTEEQQELEDVVSMSCDREGEEEEYRYNEGFIDALNLCLEEIEAIKHITK